jgi:hypothetical protein
MDVPMCRSVDSRRFGLAACVVAAGIAASAQSGGTQSPGVVRKQALRPGVLSELQAVVREGVPVGLVLAPSDRVDAPPPGGFAQVPYEFSEPGKPAALETFKQRWATAYTIAQSNGVFTVTSPRARLCNAGLARPIEPQAFSGAPFEILFEIARTFDESLRQAPPPGIVHGGGTRGMTEESLDSVTRPIILRLEGGSLQRTLSGLVTSAPRLGWVARETCDDTGKCRCYLALLTETSVLQTSYDAAAGLQVRPRDRLE